MYQKIVNRFLIEVMVVIVILAILAGLVVPKVVGQSDKARVKTTRNGFIHHLKRHWYVLKWTMVAIPPPKKGTTPWNKPPQGAKTGQRAGILKAVSKRWLG